MAYGTSLEEWIFVIIMRLSSFRVPSLPHNTKIKFIFYFDQSDIYGGIFNVPFADKSL